ncbi:hypothetical protein Tco_0505885, partial [Tanacetum coccineum]
MQVWCKTWSRSQSKVQVMGLGLRFDGKSDKGFLVGYSQQSKAFRARLVERISGKRNEAENRISENRNQKDPKLGLDKGIKSFLDELERLKKARTGYYDAVKLSGRGVCQRLLRICFFSSREPATKAQQYNIVNTALTTEAHIIEAPTWTKLVYRNKMMREEVVVVRSNKARSLQNVVLFDLEAYSDSDYAGANLDRKSTTRGCQFLGWVGLISLAIQKETICGYFYYSGSYVAACKLLSVMRLLFSCANAPFTMSALYITAAQELRHKPEVIFWKHQIRSDFFYDDADGIVSSTKLAIFDAIQLHGLRDESEQLKDYSALPQLTPSSSFPTQCRTSSESSGGNHGGQSSSDKFLSRNEGDMTIQSFYDICISLCIQVTYQAKEIKHLKAQIKKLKKKAKPVITQHRTWMKSVSLKQRLTGKKSLKSNWMQKESVSKQGRKSAKAEPLVHKDPLFDELPEDTLDFMETKDAQDVGRTREVVNEEKETADDEVSTEDVYVLLTKRLVLIRKKLVLTD